jgi:hypothetical protein
LPAGGGNLPGQQQVRARQQVSLLVELAGSDFEGANL